MLKWITKVLPGISIFKLGSNGGHLWPWCSNGSIFLDQMNNLLRKILHYTDISRCRTPQDYSSKDCIQVVPATQVFINQVPSILRPRNWRNTCINSLHIGGFHGNALQIVSLTYLHCTPHPLSQYYSLEWHSLFWQLHSGLTWIYSPLFFILHIIIVSVSTNRELVKAATSILAMDWILK